MIEVTAPCRISLAGGGTDLLPYSTLPKTDGGVVVSLAINIYQRIKLYQQGERKVNKLLKGDNVQFIRTILPRGYSIEHTFDGVTESGLGSSGALAVALTYGIGIGKDEVAQKAFEEESKFHFTGKQDHWASAYGGANIFTFTKDVECQYIPAIDIEALYPSLLLFHTPPRKKPVQSKMKILTAKQIGNLDRIKAYAERTIDAIYNHDVKLVGELMDASWYEKKMSNPQVSNDYIDHIYDNALMNGAYGGKLCGSGGGGYMVFVVPKKKREQFINSMSKFATWIDFSVDFNGVMRRQI